MARVTPQQYQEKHARRLKASSEDIRAGIDRVTEAPGQAAVQKKEKMRANINAALDDGTWERRTAAVTLQEWKTAAKEKGVGRIAAGIDAVSTKQVQMATRLLAAVDSAADQVRAMPNNNLEDSIQRMVAFTRGMAGANIKG
jgi:ElaB/YqjD/DUF883 family membrane-anchored ribosome-binding protein